MIESKAHEKVRVYYPVCREKFLLLALAAYGNDDGRSIFVYYDTLSMDTGRSVRSIRRYVRTLVMKGDLITWCDLKRDRSSNFFCIPLCLETATELEARTGISKRQLRLPLVTELKRVQPVECDADRAALLATVGVQIRPSPRASMSLGQGHSGRVTSQGPTNDNRISNDFLLERGKVMNKSREVDTDRLTFQRTAETDKLFAAAMDLCKVPEVQGRTSKRFERSEQHKRDLARVAAEREALVTTGG